MENIERAKYKKRIKVCEMFGAEEFQKVVFAAERIKFKVLKKVSPNFIKHYDKYCDKERNRMIKYAKTEEEIKEINRYTNFNKMLMRREFNSEQNRNYHINSNDLTDIYRYLKMNKKIHVESLIKDIVLIPIVAAGSILITPWLTPLLAYELISAFINIECINIQDYNICRYKLVEDKLKQREERKNNAAIKEYGDIAKVVNEKIETSDKLPSMTEIIDGFESKEQVEKFKRIVLKELKGRNIEEGKVYVRGNK